MNDRETEFKNIVKKIMAVYSDEMENFTQTKEVGSLTDSDVIIMNMNVIMSVTTNMYYWIKDILPMSVIDFDYIKVSIINNLKDSFEKIKEYEPKQKYMPLTVEQIKEIREKGFVMMKMPNGDEIKVTEKDLFIKESDAEKILNSDKKEE